MKETLKKLFFSDWSSLEKVLLLADVLLFGVLIGWLSAPRRGGFSLLSGNSLGIKTDSDNSEEDEQEEEEEEE